MSERPKEHASKACEVQASVGSNPTATAVTAKPLVAPRTPGPGAGGGFAASGHAFAGDVRWRDDPQANACLTLQAIVGLGSVLATVTGL